MGNYIFSRTGAEIEEALNRAEQVSTDDGSGNILLNGADAQTALRFLQSITSPDLNYKYINPMHSGTFASPYGAYISSGTVIDYVINLTEPGFYTAYVNRSVTDIPTEALAANSSLRGFICVSQLNSGSTKCYAYIVLIDQNSNFYVQYIQGNVGGGWKKMYVDDGGKWATIDDVTLEAEEWGHEITNLNLSEVLITVSGFAPGTDGENVKLLVNGAECVSVWHNANQGNSFYRAKALPVESGCYIEASGGSGTWQNYSPTYNGVVRDAVNSKIVSVKVNANSSFPANCKIAIIGRA